MQTGAIENAQPDKHQKAKRNSKEGWAKIPGRLLLGLLAVVTIFVAFGASMIPFRFRAGSPALLLPLKLMMPAYVWELCWFAALCAIAAAGLAWFFRSTRRHHSIAFALAILVALVNGVCSGLAANYIARVAASHDRNFAQAFGPDWKARIAAEPARPMLARRWSPFGLQAPCARVERNIAFWTIPGTQRKLLADLWLPPKGVRPAGLAFIYLHGSGWTMGDKGWGTDLMFRHLAAQGSELLISPGDSELSRKMTRPRLCRSEWLRGA